MKQVRVVILLVGISPVAALGQPGTSKHKDIELHIEPQWHNLDTNQERCQEFGGAWIEAGVIRLKKRTKDSINMTHLILSWQGERLDHLIGSLYQRKPNREFIPIEQNLICDSHWQQSAQKLIFKFLRPLSLDSFTELHLVLTVPQELEGILKNGSLKVEADYLPDQMKELLRQEPVALTFNTVCPSYAFS